MSLARGRPVRGQGIARDEILAEALLLLGAGQGLTMRALATRLGVTPMSLYRHVGDQAGLLRALADRVYAQALEGPGEGAEERADEGADEGAHIRALLIRYHQAVARYPQLTLAIFATPQAFAGVTREITERLTALLQRITDQPLLWRDILVDHAHGSGLALAAGQAQPEQMARLQQQYRQALERLLDGMF